MGLLYGRSTRVSFGRVTVVQSPTATNITSEPFTVINNLFTQFEVVKTSEKNANTVRINIHNLNQTSRSTLESPTKVTKDGSTTTTVNTVIRLEAGYKEDIAQIFIGNVVKAASSKQGTEFVTSIEAGDGSQALKSSQINKTLGAGATTKQVVQELASALGKGIGAVKGIVDDVFQNGITLTGDVTQRLDEITNKMNLEWSIQDDKLQILPPDEPSENSGLLITPDTGLIGSPVEREDSKTGAKFLEFTSLLRGSVKPGVSIQLQSRDFNGFFKVRKVTFSGDNRKGPFYMDCEAKEVPSGAVQSNQLLTLSPTEIIA